MSDLNETQISADDVDEAFNGAAATANQDAMSEWEQALAEQAQATLPAAAEPAATAVPPAQVFKPLDAAAGAKLGEGFDIDMIRDIPVQLSVELGRTRVTIRELLQLNQGSVVELQNLAGEPMDIYINGYLVAQGEVVVVGDNYGVRLTDIVTPSERLSRLAAKR
ncbi:flagellar motor switch protein FliN [Bordetella sp. 02P26C-1]|uniref:flagellar motor switch protein FliN n=1 Tax=Bordetella sp. 02P26C-1 TaxID=2683195 RepID=UPI0013553D6E|nr:flagellar motor switch protein FliN [Bordetella sp. 02P26C-1]